MTEFDQDQFDESLNKFYRKLESLTDSIGRGGSGGAKTSEEKNLAANTREKSKLEQHGVDVQKKSNKATEEQIDSTENLTKSQKILRTEQDKLEWSMKHIQNGYKSFGKSLLDEKANFHTALGGLGQTLSKSYGGVERVVGGAIIGVSYAIGAMQNFAESAKDMGNFADLSAFQVGSVRQAKVLSGLGDSFIKVIEQSNGTFKALGGNSQDAVENLSNLSRSFRYGSSYLNSAMKKSLGTDLIKSVNKASHGIAAMGLTTEDQANLEGSILASTMLNAKNEDDAKQKFVKAMEESVTSARDLSDAFGMSAKSVLAAMAEFRKTQAGTVAGLEGNKGADQLYAVLKEFPSLGTDPAKLANVASAMAEGDMAKAQYNIRDNPEATQLMQQLFQASQGAVSKDGLDTEKFNKNMDGLRSEIDLMYESRKGQQGYNDKYAQSSIEGKAAQRKRDIASGKIEPDKKTKEEKVGKSETDNIKSMNNITAALESLRGVMIGLTAGVLALLGPVLAIALSGGIGGMLLQKGLKGTLLSLLKLPGAILTATLAFYETSGGFKGMWESTKAFGKGLLESTKAIYDSRGGFKGMWESTKAFGSTVWDATSKFGKSMWDATKAMYYSRGGIIGMLKSVKDFGITLLQAGARAMASLWTMAVTVYQTVVPALIAMARSAWASMLGGFGNLGKVLGSVVGSFGKLGKFIGPVVGWFGKLGPWIAKLVPMLSGMVTGLGSILGGVATAIGGVLAGITAPVWGIIAAVVAVGAGVIYFWDEIVDVSKSVWQGFTNLVSWLGTGAGAIWDAITTPFVALFDWLGAGATKIWDIITAPFTALFDWLGNSWLGKKMGFGDSTTPPTTTAKLANTNTSGVEQSSQPTATGQIVGSITPVEFSSITTPSAINSDFSKTLADTNLAKAPNENNVLKDIASGLSPEAISQLMGYLSNMQSDLSAIRSNTKSDGYSPPVRLS